MIYVPTLYFDRNGKFGLLVGGRGYANCQGMFDMLENDRLTADDARAENNEALCYACQS